MAITASDVNKLRQQTGAGMMDCKNALVEADGDFEAAVDFLRKKGAKVAANRQDRDAKEGVVLAKSSTDNKSAVVISVNCETDFVAKNADFIQFAENVANDSSLSLRLRHQFTPICYFRLADGFFRCERNIRI